MIPDWEYTFETIVRALDSKEALSGVQLAIRKEKLFEPRSRISFSSLTIMIETLYQLYPNLCPSRGYLKGVHTERSYFLQI